MIITNRRSVGGTPVEEMRLIWSETNKRKLWRRIWVALARVQSDFGLVTAAQVEELEAHATDIDVEAALATGSGDPPRPDG